MNRNVTKLYSSFHGFEFFLNIRSTMSGIILVLRILIFSFVSTGNITDESLNCCAF